MSTTLHGCIARRPYMWLCFLVSMTKKQLDKLWQWYIWSKYPQLSNSIMLRWLSNGVSCHFCIRYFGLLSPILSIDYEVKGSPTCRVNIWRKRNICVRYYNMIYYLYTYKTYCYDDVHSLYIYWSCGSLLIMLCRRKLIVALLRACLPTTLCLVTPRFKLIYKITSPDKMYILFCVHVQVTIILHIFVCTLLPFVSVESFISYNSIL